MKTIRQRMQVVLWLIVVFAGIATAQAQTLPSGSGTTSDPYLIATLDNLRYLSEHKTLWSKVFKQTADIDASATSTWNSGKGFSPIGIDYDNSFTGSYDGNGHKIIGLTINRPSESYNGLFGRIFGGAEIKNIGVENVNIKGGSSYTGGLIGYARNNSNITACYTTGVVEGTKYVGGLIGYIRDNVKIINCYSTATTKGTDTIGGLVGYNDGGSTITNCYSSGKVMGTSNVGGLVGHNSSSSTVEKSYWDKETSTQTISAGSANTFGKTTAEMKVVGTYTSSSWSFPTVWHIDETGTANGGYPSLAWQGLANNFTVVPVTGVTLNKTTTSLYVGNSETLTATVSPATATDKSITWASSNTAVATVDTAGKIKALTTGSTTITVTTTDGGKTASCTVTVNAVPLAGSGTTSAPYLIATLDDLRILSEHKALWNKVFKQTADIDASATSTWNSGKGFSPIGIDYDNSFTGSYDGNGHKIIGLTINRPTEMYNGLFGRIFGGAEIKNIGVENVNIKGGSSYTGGLIGYARNNSNITACYTTGVVEGTKYVGGLIGYIRDNVKIINCYSTATTKGTDTIGGLVGYNRDGSTITNCYSSGKVTGTTNVGGLVGRNTSSTVEKSYWDKETSTQTTSAGSANTFGKTTAEMKVIGTYTDSSWSFPTVWHIDETETANGGYPSLAWQGLAHNFTPIPPTSISLNFSSLSLQETRTQIVKATILPANTTNREIVWSSDNKTVATVDSNGLITGKSIGVANITATINGTSLKATCGVLINAYSIGKTTFTTTRAVGEKVELSINAATTDQANVWIDLNGNGTKDTGEEVKTFNSSKEYTLDKQTVTIYGEITELSCSYNKLTVLDVTQNPSLTELSCGSNDLIALDVTQNRSLTKLECNYNSLTALDVTKNPSLTEFECYENELITLDVTKNLKLERLRCFNNSLTALDIGKNTNLSTLSCLGNNLINLDVTQVSNLVALYCSSNNLASLDVTQNPKLRWFDCDNNNLTFLDIANGNNSKLSKVEAKYNPNLMCIKIDKDFTVPSSGWEKDTGVTWNNSGTDCPAIAPTSINLISALTLQNTRTQVIKATVFPANATNKVVEWSSSDETILTVNQGGVITAKADTGTATITATVKGTSLSATCTVTLVPYALGKITFTTTKAVGEKIELNIKATPTDQVNVWIDLNNNGTKDTGEKVTTFNSSVEYELGSQSVTINGEVTYLSCSKNKLTALDVTKNPSLKKLSCSDNELIALDVTKNLSLTYLSCSKNQLTALDVTKNPSLTELSCSKNKLTALDVTKNLSLTELYCGGNRLITLDVSQNSKLRYLYCDSNQLGALNLTKNPKLEILGCRFNNLKALDVTKNLFLRKLECNSNRITTLNLTNNTYLESLDCDFNKLTVLDVSNNHKLKYLRCYRNKLTALDVTQNPKLTSLYCENNDLTVLNIANGKNGDFTSVYTKKNPNLSCIKIDKDFAVTTNWKKDDTATWNNSGNECSEVAPTGISLDVTSLTLRNTRTRVLEATVLPVNATNKVVEWSSSDEAIATVDAGGLITVKANTGSATITATIKGTSISATCTVNAVPYVMSKITLTTTKATGAKVNWQLDAKGLDRTNVYIDFNNNGIKDSGEEVTVFSIFSSYTIGTSKTITVYGELSNFNCGYSEVTALDVTQSLNLEYLSCEKNNITFLDLTKNSKIRSLYCDNNKINALNVTKNSNLGTLTCSKNKLTALDVSQNVKLWNLGCDDNQISYLDLTKNPTLGKVRCHNNDLTFLDIANGNNGNITELKTKGNANLSCIKIDNGFTVPSSGWEKDTGVTWNTSGTACSEVGATSISLDKPTMTLYPGVKGVLKATVLPATATNKSVVWSSSDETIATVNSGIVTGVAGSGTATITATSVDGSFTASCTVTLLGKIALTTTKDVSTNTIALTINAPVADQPSVWIDKNNNGIKETGEEVTTFNSSQNYTMGSKTFSIYGNITKLNCSGNSLSDLDMTKNTGLTFLNCGSNYLKTLDVTKQTALKKLYCSFNSSLLNLDVSKNTLLEVLLCKKIGLTSIDISNNVALKELFIVNNQIPTINTVANINLESLSCSDNKVITSLDVSSNNKLKSLSASSCDALQSIKLSSNVEIVACGENPNLASLDVSGATKLETLHCNENPLITSLNLVNNDKLKELKCGGNALKTLSLTTNINLEKLYCNGNNLKKLDLTTNTKLKWVYCNKNKLTVLNVANGNNGAITSLYATDNKLGCIKVDNGFAPTSSWHKDTGVTWNNTATACPDILVTSITLTETAKTLNVGSAFKLTESVEPETATNQTVTWSSSDTNIATVDASGKVTAVAKGTATITVKTNDSSNKTATCTIKVIKSVTGVSLNESTKTLEVGKDFTLTAAITPADATDKTVTWSSDKPAVATVDANGKVTAVAGGTATITVTTTNGSKTATCTVTVTQPVTGVSLNESTKTLEVGKDFTLTATIVPANATDKTVTWSSSDTNIATVDNSGTVTAVAEGTAKITVTTKDGGETATCMVTVTKTAVAVAGVTVKSSTSILLGKTEQLTATVSPTNATNQTVTWSSDKPAVAKVDNSGTVTAVSEGTAKITVTTKDGSKTAICTVTVTKTVVAVTGVSLDKTTANVEAGDMVQLTATVNPVSATNQAVTWSSSDETIATVDASGKVTAVSKGTATITVTTTDGSKTADCTVTVTKTVVAVTGVTVKSSTSILLGKTEQLTATVSPADATNQAVTWSSDKPAVATVDNSGTVTAVSEGTAKITVTTTDGSKTADCTVTVTKTTVAVTGVSLDKTTANVEEGKTEQLTATISPASATNQTVTWSSSDETIATVDNSGTVTAVSEGTAKITVTTKDGSKTADCTVTVTKTAVAVTSVSLDKTTANVEEGKTEQLTATISPASATNQTVTWSSSDESIATVDNSGTVTAVSEGTATITVTTKDGGETATCTVKVTEKGGSGEVSTKEITTSIVQNILTPGGDNPYWVIPELSGRKNKVIIFSELGKQVYEKENYDNSFDGNNLSKGMYYYVIQVEGQKDIVGFMYILYE